MIHTFGVLGGRGLQTPDFQNESGVPPDSRLQISRINLEYRGPGLQNLESVVWRLGSRYSRFTPEIWSLESGVPVLQIHSGNLESGVRGPVLQIHPGNLESGVRGPVFRVQGLVI